MAVITAAALSALSGDGKKYAVRSVRPAKNFGVRSPWQAAGLADNMRPFLGGIKMEFSITLYAAFTSLMSIFSTFGEALKQLYTESGIGTMINDFGGDGWKNLVMLAVACVLIYLAIGRGFEPLLLLPIAFGMLLANLPFFNPEEALSVHYHDLPGFVELFKTETSPLWIVFISGSRREFIRP